MDLFRLNINHITHTFGTRKNCIQPLSYFIKSYRSVIKHCLSPYLTCSAAIAAEKLQNCKPSRRRKHIYSSTPPDRHAPAKHPRLLDTSSSSSSQPSNLCRILPPQLAQSFGRPRPPPEGRTRGRRGARRIDFLGEHCCRRRRCDVSEQPGVPLFPALSRSYSTTPGGREDSPARNFILVVQCRRGPAIDFSRRHRAQRPLRLARVRCTRFSRLPGCVLMLRFAGGAATVCGCRDAGAIGDSLYRR